MNTRKPVTCTVNTNTSNILFKIVKSKVSLLLWHKMAPVHCFIWPLALQLWSLSKAGSDVEQIWGLANRFIIWPPKSVFSCCI